MARRKPDDVLKVKTKDKPFGRPSKYTKELADLICKRISTSSMGIKRLCDAYDDMPSYDTIFEWISLHQYFSIQYAKAKSNQAHVFAEEIIDLSAKSDNDLLVNPITGEEKPNTAAIMRHRLMIDTRKWVAAKMLPKLYGDRQVIENLTSDNEAMQEELNKLRAQLKEKNKRDY